MKNKELIYFAYGSNMAKKRLIARVGAIPILGIAELKDYQLRFNKSGADGSGKCNIMANNHHSVWGVLFVMSAEQKAILDVFEGVGHGYNAVNMQVLHNGKPLTVFVYEALHKAREESAMPYSWYKDFVSVGAKENNLPISYQESINAVVAIEDEDKQRHLENTTILL